MYFEGKLCAIPFSANPDIQKKHNGLVAISEVGSDSVHLALFETTKNHY